jgi:hypothetical protein
MKALSQTNMFPLRRIYRAVEIIAIPVCSDLSSGQTYLPIDVTWLSSDSSNAICLKVRSSFPTPLLGTSSVDGTNTFSAFLTQ